MNFQFKEFVDVDDATQYDDSDHIGGYSGPLGSIGRCVVVLDGF